MAVAPFAPPPLHATAYGDLSDSVLPINWATAKGSVLKSILIF